MHCIDPVKMWFMWYSQYDPLWCHEHQKRVQVPYFAPAHKVKQIHDNSIDSTKPNQAMNIIAKKNSEIMITYITSST